MARLSPRDLELTGLLVTLARHELHPSTNSFHQAVRLGSPFEAFYHLGKIYASSARAQVAAGLRPETCGAAVAHLKLVVERGSWKDDVVGEADRAWERGETDKAILGWWMAGERGYESAQNNLAYVLDQGECEFDIARSGKAGSRVLIFPISRPCYRLNRSLPLCSLVEEADTRQNDRSARPQPLDSLCRPRER